MYSMQKTTSFGYELNNALEESVSRKQALEVLQGMKLEGITKKAIKQNLYCVEKYIDTLNAKIQEIIANMDHTELHCPRCLIPVTKRTMLGNLKCGSCSRNVYPA